MSCAIEIFCCYAREDQSFLRKLKKHLVLLERQSIIKVWSDIDINAGMKWEEEIKKHLNTAQIILLLVSDDFICSDYCYSIEMKRAMERHEQGDAQVIPIIVRPVSWESAPFSTLQVLPTNANPIAKWDHPDDAYVDVEKEIRTIVEKIMRQLCSRKIALFGYETQGGSTSVLWTDSSTFSLNGTAYPTWLATKKKDFAEKEIVNHTWIKVGDHGYYFIIRFMEGGELRESSLSDPERGRPGSWNLIDGMLRISTNYKGISYELDMLASQDGLMCSGVEYKDGEKDPHAYFVLLPSRMPNIIKPEARETVRDTKPYEDALNGYDKIIHYNPRCGRAYRTQGDILRNLKRYEESLAAYQRSIEMQPSRRRWRSKGEVLYEIHRYEEALKAFEQAIKLAGNYAGAWHGKGQTLYELQRYEEAVTAFDQAIKCDSRLAVAWREKGKTLQKLERYEEALIAYERVLKLEPDDVSIWTGKGKVLRELQRYDEAITAYEEALRREFDCVDAYLGKGRVYLDLERYNDALKVYEQATNIAPNNVWTWHDKGVALGYLQRAEEALEAFEHAIGLDPENKWAWFHKAETLTYLAQQAYKKAGRPGREPLKREYYNLVQKATGNCLDGNGSRVYMHFPNDGDFQLWRAIEVSPNTIILKHFWSGKVLEATVERGTYFSEYNDSPSQQWILEDIGDGYQKLRQVATGMFLHGDTNNDVYLQPESGRGFEIWRAVKMHITSLIAPHDSSNSAEFLVFER